MATIAFKEETMQYNIYGNNLEITKAIQEHVSKAIDKINKRFPVISHDVTISDQGKGEFRIQVNYQPDHCERISVSKNVNEVYLGINQAFDAVIKIAEKNKPNLRTSRDRQTEEADDDEYSHI
jgi:ribosomal subunit interface protein